MLSYFLTVPWRAECKAQKLKPALRPVFYRRAAGGRVPLGGDDSAFAASVEASDPPALAGALPKPAAPDAGSACDFPQNRQKRASASIGLPHSRQEPGPRLSMEAAADKAAPL